MVKQLWFGFWIRVAYLFNLRWASCEFMRWWSGEHKAPRVLLPVFNTPEEVQTYVMSHFQYRKDQFELKLFKRRWFFMCDWVSHPEVFQGRLMDKTTKDGDCDDIHFWVARALLDVPGVEEVYLLSSGFKGGAHATTVFLYKDQWKHFDYHIYDLKNPNLAPDAVTDRYTKKGVAKETTFWNFERVTGSSWSPAAIIPRKLPA